jgi:hypothetical protein
MLDDTNCETGTSGGEPHSVPSDKEKPHKQDVSCASSIVLGIHRTLLIALVELSSLSGP